jgi:filamentous hemagglutinin family protein
LRVQPAERSRALCDFPYSHVVFIALLLHASVTHAAPAGSVVGGPAVGTINQSGATTQVNLNATRAVINWTNFNIANGQAVSFRQPNASSVVLNRISGAQTTIDGTLNANGRVFLVNQRGILFGPNASVNVGSLVAMTADTSADLFLAGDPAFRTVSPTTSTITNRGRITTQPNGNVLLLAPTVVNQGTIAAPNGTIVLATGRAFLVDLFGDGLVQFASAAVTGLPSNRVTQVGNLEVGDGTVLVRRAVGAASLVGTLNSVPLSEVASEAVALPGGAVAFVGPSTVLTATVDTSWIKPPTDNGGGGVIDPSPIYHFSAKSASGVAAFDPPPAAQAARLSEFNRLGDETSGGNLVRVPNATDMDAGNGMLYMVGEPGGATLAQAVGFTQARPTPPAVKQPAARPKTLPCTVSELVRQGCR